MILTINDETVPTNKLQQSFEIVPLILKFFGINISFWNNLIAL